MHEENGCSVRINSEVKYKRHPAAVLSKSDNQIIIFQSNHCYYLSINDTGYSIWRILKRPTTLNAMCYALSKEYSVDYLLCEQEVDSWLEHALAKDIVQIVAVRNESE